MGVRELIWALIGVLAIYVAWQLLRLGRRRPAAAEALPAEAYMAPPPEGSGDGPAPSPPTVTPADDAALRAEIERMALEMQQLRRDVTQLRSEQEVQRRECRRLEEELGEVRDTLAGLQAAQNVSPQYGEAVMLARRGLESEAIAERCGISVAEAALVRSLAGGGEAGGARGEG